ncbi:MAG: efflux RND transporter periplasmic adaptor subunit [Epsilonproteobacteria bacterium]|nr:efflux RND transporter periplasmic adaptor subunit [Campylobacterota bacterium]
MRQITIAVLTSLILATNAFSGAGHDHDHEGHDHAQHQQEENMPSVESDKVLALEPEVVTHFSDTAELFVEFSPLIMGETSTFLAHFTKLSDFKPVESGVVEVCLNYKEGDQECFEIKGPARKGLFKPLVTPGKSGKAEVLVNLFSPTISSHKLGTYNVAVSIDEYTKNVAVKDKRGDEKTPFLKEQQWEIAFATAEVKMREMRPSLLTFGRFELPSSAQQTVLAPVSGMVIPMPDLHVGTQVKVGDTLGFITPTLGEREDTATLTFQLQRAKANLRLATTEYQRLHHLKAENVISKKRLLEAENVLSIAKAELKSIKTRIAQIDPKVQSGVAIKSRIAGTIVSQNIISGSYVNAGENLFHVADTSTLWLNIQVAEADIEKVKKPSGVTLHHIKEDITLSDEHLKMLYFSDIIDSKTATASLLFAVNNKLYHFRSGARFSLRLYTNDTEELLTIPRSAVVDDSGIKVVYVLVDGEHFERRVVETGIIDGETIAVLSGLKAGERVVSKGAYRVLLAGLSPAEAGHGHAH